MKRVQQEIFAGTILVLLSVVMLLLLGFQEEKRLSDYVQFQAAA